jgi:adenylate kinase family enzyme
MSDYDFSSLNDKEFEDLSADLLTCHLGSRVERFKVGRDGGVDGRFFSSEGDEVIIQCKHWIKSGIAALIRSIEKTEADKVRKISPKRYVFVTSLELSRVNKIKIKNLLSPYILSESDVFGNEDLNDILSNNIGVERKHYKLWISSTNVLQTILSSAIIGRSRHKLEEIIEESNRYVVTQSHIQAIEKLENIHSVIITGSPGVGKTSLADQLCQYYTAKGFEFCFIENSLNEAEDIYNDESKQVFYFDDFLGRNFLLALNSHQDSHVINFIKRIERDKKKRFVLTSRSNILNQGKRLSDLFDIKKVDRNEYELSISSLTDIDKAKILYNHIWFGDLNEEYIDQIYEEKRYLQIIKHKNFNPRLISFITDQHRLSNINSNQYWEYIGKTLSNPKDIWRNVFEIQIDDICKHIVIAVSLHGQPLSEKELSSLYGEILSSNLSLSSRKDYESVIKLLVGALLNRSVLDKEKISYDLFNPSIADFVISNYLTDFNYIDQLLLCLKTPQSIYNLNSLMTSGVIEQQYFCNIIESQLLSLSKSHKANEIDTYKLRILASASSMLSPQGEVIEYIQCLVKSALISGPCSYGYDYFEFINWSLSLGYINATDSTFQKQLNSWVYEYEKDMDEFIPISNLVSTIELSPASLTEKLKEEYLEYLSDGITSDVIEEGILNNEYEQHTSDYPQLEDYISERFSELGISFEQADVDYVKDCCDIDEIIQSNINSAMYEDDGYDRLRDQGYSMESSTDAIDDLFER